MEGLVKRLFSASWWLLAIFFLALFLVACERPLQDDLPVDSTTPGADQPLLTPEGTLPSFMTPTPGGAYPGPGQEGEAYPGPGAEEGEAPGGELPSQPEPTAPATESAQPQEDVIYTVVAGDTLGSIATQYGITVEEIAEANNLSNIHTLDVGQQLLIPLGGGDTAADTTEPAAEATEAPAATEQEYIVQAGDNLYRIGLRYGFTVEELTAYNNLANPNSLEIGQRILIPPEGYTVP